MSGRSVFVTDADDGNQNVILETVAREGRRSPIRRLAVRSVLFGE